MDHPGTLIGHIQMVHTRYGNRGHCHSVDLHIHGHNRSHSVLDIYHEVVVVACSNDHKDQPYHRDLDTGNHGDLDMGSDFVGVIYKIEGHVTEKDNNLMSGHDIGLLHDNCHSNHHVSGIHRLDSRMVLDMDPYCEGVSRVVGGNHPYEGGVSIVMVVPRAVRMVEAVTLAVWVEPMAVRVVEVVTLAVWAEPYAVREVEVVTLAVLVEPMAVRVVEVVTLAVWVEPLAVRMVEAVTLAVWVELMAVRMVEVVTLAVWAEPRTVRVVEVVTLAVWTEPHAVRVVKVVTLVVWAEPHAVTMVEDVTLAVWAEPLAVRMVDDVTLAV